MPGFVGFPEIIMLLVVALLVFGPKKLPEMGRSLGHGLREFKDSVTNSNPMSDTTAAHAPESTTVKPVPQLEVGTAHATPDSTAHQVDGDDTVPATVPREDARA